VVLPGPDASLVGKQLADRYEILEVIGDGGVGVVYRARDLQASRSVALKVLHETLVDESGFVGRFRREAQAMSLLQHPHCVAVLDSGFYESRPYLVLDYLRGQTIAELLEQGAFDPPRAVRIALQLLETLAYFHEHHVIHRDLKSENVMVVESRETKEFVKVLDFGMAKILTGPGADSQLSKIGIVPGTPSVMAPEQIYQLPPDPRIDIYATGILLYEMIVGRRPFTGPDLAAVVKMQISKRATPPREVLGEDALSAELEQVIIKALEKDRLDRFGTAADMAEALRLTPEANVPAPPFEPSQPSTPPPAPRRAQPWLLGVAGSAVLVAGAIAASQLWSKSTPPPLLAATATLQHARSEASATVPAPATPAPAQVAAAAALPPVTAWAAHRDRALEHAARGQHEEAFAAIKAALTADASAAGADPALLKLAVSLLDRARLPFVLDAFRANAQLVPALTDATSQGPTTASRHTAFDGLKKLGEAARADQVAMLILDVEQAPACGRMRAAFKQLRASKDPRVKAFKADLQARGRKDRHVRCLKRLL